MIPSAIPCKKSPILSINCCPPLVPIFIPDSTPCCTCCSAGLRCLPILPPTCLPVASTPCKSSLIDSVAPSQLLGITTVGLWLRRSIKPWATLRAGANNPSRRSPKSKLNRSQTSFNHATGLLRTAEITLPHTLARLLIPKKLVLNARYNAPAAAAIAPIPRRMGAKPTAVIPIVPAIVVPILVVKPINTSPNGIIVVKPEVKTWNKGANTAAIAPPIVANSPKVVSTFIKSLSASIKPILLKEKPIV